MLNKRKVRRAVSLLVFMCLLLAIILVCCNVFGSSTLTVGLYESDRPLTYLDEKKAVSGFEPELAKLLANNLNKKLKIKLLKPDEFKKALNDGSVDCILSVRQSVHHLLENFETTEPFISYGVVLVVSPDDASILSEVDLHKKRIGVMVNTDAELLCEEFLKDDTFDVRKYDIESQPFQDLKLKKNDAVIADELYSRFIQKENPESYRTLDAVYQKRTFGLRLSRKLSQDDIAQIEDELRQIKSNATFKMLYLDWFGYDLS